jgi:hypothetical protein
MTGQKITMMWRGRENGIERLTGFIILAMAAGELESEGTVPADPGDP